MDKDLDSIWKALSDPTRREILDRLRHGPLTTSQLVAAFPHLSRFGVMKHLDQLKQCRLVVVRKQGRYRYNSLNAVPLRQIYDHWVSKFADHWAQTLIDIKGTTEQSQ